MTYHFFINNEEKDINDEDKRLYTDKLIQALGYEEATNEESN